MLRAASLEHYWGVSTIHQHNQAFSYGNRMLVFINGQNLYSLDHKEKKYTFCPKITNISSKKCQIIELNFCLLTQNWTFKTWKKLSLTNFRVNIRSVDHTLMNNLALLRSPSVVWRELSPPTGTISFNFSRQFLRWARRFFSSSLWVDLNK